MEIWSQYKLCIFKIRYPSPICPFFSLESFSLYEENNVFLTFIKTIVDITIPSWSIGWLAYFCRWATLIGSFELHTNTRSNIFNSLQPLIILANSANTKYRPFQVKINCSIFIIDGLQERCHITFLVSLFVTSRNLLSGVFLPNKIITILQKIAVNFRQVSLKGALPSVSILECFGKIFSKYKDLNF